MSWLKSEGIEHQFHDLRTDGLDEKRVRRWIDACGWEKVLNRRSTTWRGLSDQEKSSVEAESAVRLILEHLTLAKRPIFETGADILIGFTDDVRKHLK